jgi:hypothetical protein
VTVHACVVRVWMYNLGCLGIRQIAPIGLLCGSRDVAVASLGSLAVRCALRRGKGPALSADAPMSARRARPWRSHGEAVAGIADGARTVGFVVARQRAEPWLA